MPLVGENQKIVSPHPAPRLRDRDDGLCPERRVWLPSHATTLVEPRPPAQTMRRPMSEDPESAHPTA